MKFMMMMNMPRGTGDYQINQWTPEAISAHIQFMKDLNPGSQEIGRIRRRAGAHAAGPGANRPLREW